MAEKSALAVGVMAPDTTGSMESEVASKPNLMQRQREVDVATVGNAEVNSDMSSSVAADSLLPRRLLALGRKVVL